MKAIFSILGMLILLSACQSDSTSEKNEVMSSDSVSSVVDEKIYLAQGNQLVKRTFDTLSASLKNAIQQEGIAEALKFCNVNAYALTNVYANNKNAIIKRASTKNRNTTNAADSLEMLVLADYEREKSSGVDLVPKVITKGETVHYFKPILVQALCLNCHGEVGKGVNEKNYQVIKAIYPQDKAVGYQLDDLRGVWHIQWKINPKN